MYYGDAVAGPMSDGDAVFLLFDDTSEASCLGTIHWEGIHGVATEWDLPDNAFAVDWMNTGEIWIDEMVGGTVSTLNGIIRIHDLNWHTFQLRYYNGQLEVLYDNTDTISTTSAETFTNNYIGFTGREIGSNNNYFCSLEIIFYIKNVCQDSLIFENN